MDAGEPLPEIGVGASYGDAWRQLWPNFLMLFLIGIISGLIGAPSTAFSALSNILGEGIGRADDSAYQIGAAVVIVAAGFFSFVYGVLVVGPLSYGVTFAHLKAARDDRVDVKDMFEAFHNYWNAVLANLLVGAIVGIGFVLLIVPGIVFACKLAFTPYLIVDRKLGVIDAVQESWRLTNGHGWKVFALGLLAIPIFIAGLLCFFVGVIVSIMWAKLAFASLYHAVSTDDAEFGLDDLRAGSGVVV